MAVAAAAAAVVLIELFAMHVLWTSVVVSLVYHVGSSRGGRMRMNSHINCLPGLKLTPACCWLVLLAARFWCGGTGGGKGSKGFLGSGSSL